MNRPSSSLRFALPVLASLGLLAFACAPSGSESREAAVGAAQGGVTILGTAQSFAVLGGSTVTNANASTLTGDLGVSPGLAITGFPPGIVVGGTVHKGDAVALQAQSDVTAAYLALAGQHCNGDMTGVDLGGTTLKAGVYCFSSSAQLTGELVLDAEGKADATFVFQMVSTLTTASNASVRIINGGSSCNVYWQVGSSATIGTGTTFAGSILALTSISVTHGASISGRALARNGAVTMDDNAIDASTCVSAGASDAGVDAAKPDAAKPDGGVASDAAVSPDANAPDASVPDAAAFDSGATDAGTTDADAGTGTP